MIRWPTKTSDAVAEGAPSIFQRILGRALRATRSSYLRGIATLSGGQMLAAIIPFLAAPILGRVYTPGDYALLAAYVSVVNIAAALVTFHYHHAVLTERSSRRAYQMAVISIVVTTAVSILMMPVVAVIFFMDPFAIDARGSKYWFCVLPLSTFVSGLSLAAMAVVNRAQRYSALAMMQIIAASASACASIAFGLLGLRSDGLLLAYVLSQSITLGFSTYFLLKFRVQTAAFSRRKLAVLFLRHRGFPLFTMPAAFLQSFTVQLPVFVLTVIGASSALGAFSRAQGLLLVPVAIFSTAISRVYFQRAASDYSATGSCRSIFLKTIPLISFFALPLMISFLFFGENIFVFYLGVSWREAGQIAGIIAPALALQMFVGALGSPILFSGNQHLSIYIHVSGIALALLGCVIPLLFSGGAHGVLRGWVIAICILNFIQIFLGWRLSLDRGRSNIFTPEPTRLVS